MGITSSTKELNTGSVPCGGTFEVTLGLTAAPDIVSNPTDIVLILDRSGSMAGRPPENLKKGAKKFIDIIDEATDGAQDGQIGNGSRIGIVSFASTATQETQLIILSVSKPDKGSAELLDERTLQWKIEKLGVGKSEGATLKFTVRHNGQCSGLLTVNEDIDYTDNEGNTVEFDDPKIKVDCGDDEFPEPCPTPVEITIDGCEDAVEFDAGDLHLESLGRILQLDVTLKNICPRKRVALAVLLYELDDKGHECKRGLKTVVVPAHEHPTCRDVTVRCIKFVLPESLDASGAASKSEDTTFLPERKSDKRFS